MKPVSSRWESTIRGSHRMVARATVCETFQTGTSPTGTRIPIVAGAVTLDGTADVRGTLDLTTDGTRRWPARAADLLAPYGTEIFVERGVQYSDALVEYVPLGYYRIDTIAQDDPADGPIAITCQDRMAGLIDGRMVAPRQFTAGSTFGSIVDALVTEVYPDAVIAWDSGDSDVLARGVIVEEDRFRFLDEAIRSRGKIWYWAGDGTLTIVDVPDPGSPVFDVTAGRDGVLVSSQRQLSRIGVYNAIVASGEGIDTTSPARAVAYDANPLSPTYYYGPFGPVPDYLSSPLIDTPAKAVAAASAQLRRQLGLPYVVSFASVPNPALEPYDPVRIRSRASEGIETHVLEQVTIPLVALDPMTATTREQTHVLVGSLS